MASSQPRVILAVIFDMDGLMLDTESIAQVAWVRAAKDYGYHFPDQVFRGVVGRSLPDVQRYIYDNLGADFPFDDVYHQKQAYVEESVAKDGLPLKPGLLELLDFLNKLSLKKAVASSSPLSAITHNLALVGLDGCFETLVGGDQIQHGKPAPDIFLEAARKLGVPPAACLVLEDSNAGVKSAHTAGMKPVMVPDLIPPTEETQSLAYRIVPSLFEVRGLLGQLLDKS